MENKKNLILFIVISAIVFGVWQFLYVIPYQQKQAVLQKQQQANSPIIETFQEQAQIAMSPKVSGYVNGAIHDFVFYRLVKKS